MNDLGKVGAVIVAAASGVLGFAAMTVLGPAKLQYADSSEERQQQRLENIANGFRAGYAVTSGGHSEITRITADAERDLVAVDIRFTNKLVEHAGYNEVSAFREGVLKHACAFLDKKGVISEGVTMKLRMTKPSGARLTDISLSEEGCAPYLKRA